MAKTQTEILMELCENLPTFSSEFLLSRVAEKSVGTRLGYGRDFSAFLDWIKLEYPNLPDKKDLSVTDMGCITPIDIDRYISIYLATHSESATARSKVAISAHFKYICNTLGALSKNPVNGAGIVRIPKKDYIIYLTDEEQSKLLSTIEFGYGLTEKQLNYHEKLKSRDMAIIILFLDTGLRVSELVGIDIGDIDFDECSIVVTRKRKRIQKIYYSDECKAYLKTYLEERHSLAPTWSTVNDPLFVSLKGERLTPRQIEKLVSKYVAASLPTKAHISPHKLRSTFAMAFYGATKDILTLQAKMGHDSLNTTNIYAKASQSQEQQLRNWKQ